MYALRVTNSYKPGLIGYSIGAIYQKADAFLWNNDFERKNANLNTTFDLPTDGDLSFGFRYSNTVVGLIRNNRAVDQDSGDPDDPNDPGYNIPSIHRVRIGSYRMGFRSNRTSGDGFSHFKWRASVLARIIHHSRGAGLAIRWGDLLQVEQILWHPIFRPFSTTKCYSKQLGYLLCLNTMVRRVPSILGLVVVVSYCGSDESSEDEALQSGCVHSNINVERTLADGEECANFSYSDCGGDPFPMASECQNYCAFDLCQAGPCIEDSDCRSIGISWECTDYIVSGDDYGRWCKESDCPKGSPGCPCLPGGTCIAPDSLWVVECNDQDICVGEDSCPSGCRAGSVCCGGTLCGGDCIGTPCC